MNEEHPSKDLQDLTASVVTTRAHTGDALGPNSRCKPFVRTKLSS